MSVTFEEVREARRVTALLALEVAEKHGWSDGNTAGLIEAKRQLGIAISDSWPDRLMEVIEEQG